MESSQFSFWPEQASAAAAEVDALFIALIGITVFFTVGIVVALAYLAIKYRRRSDDDVTADIHGSMLLEITWSVIPLLIVMATFVWGAKIYFQQYRVPVDAMDIRITGKQWMWKVQHPNGKREINHVYLPINQPVQFTMTSEDVIHSVFVPAFRVKKDAVPGRFSSTWFTPTKLGEYHLFCTEYCGTEHSLMIGSVTVLEADEYAAWLEKGAGISAVASGGTPSDQGRAMFAQLGCETCHSGDSGARGPNLQGVYGKPVELKSGESVNVSESYLRESILNPTASVVAGFEPIMPTYQGQINEEGLSNLVAYIKSLSDKKEATQ